MLVLVHCGHRLADVVVVHQPLRRQRRQELDLQPSHVAARDLTGSADNCRGRRLTDISRHGT